MPPSPDFLLDSLPALAVLLFALASLVGVGFFAGVTFARETGPNPEDDQETRPGAESQWRR